MLVQSRQLLGMDIVSMRSGERIARATRALIDPFRLEICGLYTDQAPGSLLLLRNSREISQQQIIVDDIDALSTPDELPRLKEIIELDYSLLGKHVRTESKQRLGKVGEYVVDTLSYQIQKIHATQPIWRNFQGTALIIDRKQIIELDDEAVIVSDAIVRSTALAAQQTI